MKALAPASSSSTLKEGMHGHSAVALGSSGRGRAGSSVGGVRADRKQCVRGGRKHVRSRFKAASISLMNAVEPSSPDFFGA